MEMLSSLRGDKHEFAFDTKLKISVLRLVIRPIVSLDVKMLKNTSSFS